MLGRIIIFVKDMAAVGVCDLSALGPGFGIIEA
jgi:hypothetical protein